MQIYRLYKGYLLCIIICISGIAKAQTYQQVRPSNESPYHTILTHLYFLQKDTYDPAETRIAFPAGLDSATAVTKAQQIKSILDAKGLYVQLNKVSQNPNYTDSLTGQNTYTLFPGELPQIYLVKENNGWIYAPATLDALPSLMKKTFPFGTDFLVKLFPYKSSTSFLGLYLWQYFGILLILLAAGMCYWLLSRLFKLLLHTGFKEIIGRWKINDKHTWQIARIISWLVTLALINRFVPVLKLPVGASKFVIAALRIAGSFMLAVLVWRVFDVIVRHLRDAATQTSSKLDDQFIPIIDRVIKIMLVLVAAIYILNQLDVNVTALIAGISIGGLALALAAQDTVKNFLGSIMIFMDHPFQIGDYVEIDGKMGTIEEVGFRSTRIRTVDTSLITVPNGNIANLSINNMGIRPRRMLQMQIGVTYDTPPRYIEAFVAGMRDIVITHPKLADEPNYVHLYQFDNSSINILFRAYIETAVYAEELAIREEVLLAIMHLAESIGVRFAFPSSTIYIEDMPGQLSKTPVHNQSKEDLMQSKEAWLVQWRAGIKTGDNNED